MRPCESVLVTVLLNKDGVDMELPAFMPIGELKRKIYEAVAVIRPGLQMRPQEMALFSGNKELQDNASLASSGIWDGSIIRYTPKVEDI